VVKNLTVFSLKLKQRIKMGFNGSSDGESTVHGFWHLNCLGYDNKEAKDTMHRKKRLFGLEVMAAIKEGLNHANTQVSLQALSPTTLPGAASIFWLSCRRIKHSTQATIFWGFKILLFHLNS
jgi:hypothetical protein